MKKLFKVGGIVSGVLVLIVTGFLVYSAVNTHKALNAPRLPDNYYELSGDVFNAGGSLEEKYSGRGACELESLTVKSDNASIKNIYLYYPADLKTKGGQYPLIIVVNGSQSPAKTYLPFFERLASWGFIVAGNDDPQPGTGETASITLDYVLNESEIKENIDLANIGAVGYSQGGAGAINAVTKFANSGLYKALFTGSAAYPLLSVNMGWGYDPADIALDYFMTAATGSSDDTGVADVNAEYGGVSPLAALTDIYNSMPDSVTKVRGRCVNAEHGDMQLRTDGYMTAWMLWELQGNEEAGSAFFGEDAEILRNANWQDVEINK